MKFTVSTLLALCIAVPVTVVQAFDLKVTITSTLAGGAITIFPGGGPIDQHHKEGEDPLVVGSLQLTGIGPDSYGRFDVIDTSLAPNDYTQCRIWAIEDPKVEKLDFLVEGSLVHLYPTAPGHETQITYKCKSIKNGDRW